MQARIKSTLMQNPGARWSEGASSSAPESPPPVPASNCQADNRGLNPRIPRKSRVLHKTRHALLAICAVPILMSCAEMSSKQATHAEDGESLQRLAEHAFEEKDSNAGVENEAVDNEERQKWMEDMHRASPGVNWREIEKANAEALKARRSELRKAKKNERGAAGTAGAIAGQPQPINAPAVGTGTTLTPAAATADASRWSERGGTLPGRMYQAALSSDGQSLYAGAFASAWRGSLDGQNWTPLNDDVYGGAFWLTVVPGVNTTDPDIIIRSGDDLRTYISRDAGATWNDPVGLPPLSANPWVRRIVATKDSSHAIFAVITYRNGTQDVTDVFRSIDRAVSFQKLTNTGMGTFKGDLWVPRNGVGDIYLLSSNATVMRSSNNGDTWTTAGSIPVPASQGSITYSLNESELIGSEAGAPRLWVIANVVKTDSSVTPNSVVTERKLYRSDNAGVSWSVIYTQNTSLPQYCGNRCSGSAASIADPNVLVYGGVDTFRSTDGGVSFTTVGGGNYITSPDTVLHPDNRAIDVVPCTVNATTCPTGENWYMGTDGGLYRSLDRGLTVHNLTLAGMGATMTYGTHTSTQNASRIAAGIHDQGYQYNETQTSKGVMITTFKQLVGGDYGQPMSGDGSHQYVYAAYREFVLVQIGETQPISSSADMPPIPQGESRAWLPVLAADPDDITGVFFGQQKLYRYTKSSSGNSWSYAQWGNLALTNEFISALAFSPLNHNHAYLATDKGRLFYSADKGQTWILSNLLSGASIGYVRALLVSAKSSGTGLETVYAGGSGYGSFSSVLRSTDGGASYGVYDQLPTTGNLDTLVYGLCEAPNASGTLFAATESSVYRRDPADPANNAWRDVSGTATPVIYYWSCESVKADQLVRMSSWGRGIWDYQMSSDLSTSISAAQPVSGTVTYTVSATNNGPDVQGDGIVDISGDLPASQAVLPLPQNCVNGGTVISCNLGDLTVGKTASVNVSFNLSGRTGSTTMQANISAQTIVNDPDTTNNLSFATINPDPIDLAVRAISGPATIDPGTVVTLGDTVCNHGYNAAGGFDVRYYLSSDAQITTADQYIGARTLSGLAANNTCNSGSITWSVGTSQPPGSFYIGAIADSANAVAEINKNNNALAQAVLIKSIVPEVGQATSSNLQQTTVTLTATVTLNTPSASVYGECTVGGYQSPEVSITASGAVQVEVKNLTANTTYTCRVGAYGRTSSGATTADGKGAYVTFTTLAYPPTITTTGVSNIQQTTATLSATVDTKGVAAGVFGVCTTSAGVTTNYMSVTKIPATNGPVSIGLTGLVPDTTYACHMNAWSNYSGNVPDTVGLPDISFKTLAYPDLVVSALTASVVSGSKPLSVKDQVTNQGNANAGTSFAVAFYLSTDTVLNTSTDILTACTRTITSLAANTANPLSTTLETKCKFPTAAISGTSYYVFAVVDSGNTVTESNETNNSRMTTAVKAP